MQVALEHLTGLKRRLTITLPADQIDSGVSKRLQTLVKRVRLNGFRPGKVPMAVLKQRYGADARQEVLAEMLQTAFTNAVKQEKLEPVSKPDIEQSTAADGSQDVAFVLTFEVYPAIQLNDFANITIERPVATVSEADIDTMIDNLRWQRRTFAEVARPAQPNDQVTLDYAGALSNSAAVVDDAMGDSMTADNAILELGSKTMIPGFEEGLVGLSAGDETVLTLTFPEDYDNDQLAGQAVEFTCNIHTVSAPQLPALDDIFFNHFGVQEGGLAAFRAELANNMHRELGQAIKQKLKGQVLAGLLQGHTLELPEALVAEEADRLGRQFVQRLSTDQDHTSFKANPELKTLFTEQAKKHVTVSLLIGAIIKQHGIQLDEKRVQAVIDDAASAYQDPQQMADWYYRDKTQLASIQRTVLEEQAMDAVLQGAAVHDKPCSYQEAMGGSAASANQTELTANAPKETSETLAQTGTMAAV